MNDLIKYLEALVDPFNPIVISFIILVVILVFFIIVVKFIIVPLKIKHRYEKEKLENEKLKLIALFAELDPDPVLRVNYSGEIIQYNSSALSLWLGSLNKGTKINCLFPELDLDVKNIIDNDMQVLKELNFSDSFYRVIIKGIAEYKFIQVYLHDITDRVNYSRTLLKTQEKMKKLAIHLSDTLEEERYRIGTELHDHIGQMLLLLKMKLNTQFESNGSMNEFNDFMEGIIENLRTIVYDLKPKLLEQTGIENALHALVGNFIDSSKIKGKLNVAGSEIELDDRKKIFLYRVVQESLNNILKHSKANKFIVNLEFDERNVYVEVKDNGIGFDKEKIEYGNGILNMQQRIEAFNGEFKIKTEPGSGTSIMASVSINGN